MSPELFKGRKAMAQSFEIMNNISRENDEIWLEHISHMGDYNSQGTVAGNMPNMLNSKSRKNYEQYFKKTAREIAERPHEVPRIIAQASRGKYFSSKFPHFCAKLFSSFRNFPAII